MFKEYWFFSHFSVAFSSQLIWTHWYGYSYNSHHQKAQYGVCNDNWWSTEKNIFWNAEKRMALSSSTAQTKGNVSFICSFFLNFILAFTID